jgi:hypothetical protein
MLSYTKSRFAGKIKNFYWLVFMLLLTAEIFPQWVQTDGPYGGNIRAFAVNGTNLFAGTEGGGVFLSTNNGSSWTSVNSGLTNTSVLSLAVSNNETGGTNLFAGTSGNGVFLSTNNGTSWSEVNSGLPNNPLVINAFAVSPNETGSSNLFASVQSLDSAFQSLVSTGIFLSTNNGISWTLVDHSQRFSITSLAVIENYLFVGSSWGGGLLRFTDIDSGWTVDTVLTGTSVFCLAVSGSNLFAGTYDGVVLSTDYGITWKEVKLGLPLNWPVYTLAINGTNLYANTGEKGVYRSTNYGSEWTAANSGLNLNRGSPYIHSFAVIPNDTGEANIFAGSWDGVFLSTDNGINWTSVNKGITNTWIYGFGVIPYGINQTNLITCTGSREIFISTDNGNNWSQINRFSDYDIFSFIYCSNEAGGINILAGGNGIFLSTDNGISWTTQGLTNTRVFSFAAIPDGKGTTNLFAGTENQGVFLSTNSGTSWTAVNSGLTSFYINDLVVNGMNLFAGTEDGVFLSTDNGTNWRAVSNGLPKDDQYGYYLIRDLEVSETNLFVASYYGVFLSTNNGTSWNEINSGLTNTDVSALIVSPDGMYLFAGTTGSGVFLSTDNGTSWNEINLGLPENLYVSSFVIDGMNLYIGTGGCGIWRRPLSEMITAVESSSELPTNFVLYQNYPNPFNPTTNIQFQIVDFGIVSLKIYDVLGNDVATLVNEEKPAGTYEVTWNAANLPSGVYFYQLKAGSFIATKKLLMLK